MPNLHSLTYFTGVLFVCMNIDHRLLYQELNEQTIEDGFLFYTTFYNAPPAIKVRNMLLRNYFLLNSAL